jgi:hypothetical protein
MSGVCSDDVLVILFCAVCMRVSGACFDDVLIISF